MTLGELALAAFEFVAIVAVATAALRTLAGLALNDRRPPR